MKVEQRQPIHLKAREEDFVLCVVLGAHPTRAAVASGWAIGSAYRLLRKPAIMSSLHAIRDNVDYALRVSQARGKIKRAEAGGGHGR